MNRITVNTFLLAAFLAVACTKPAPEEPVQSFDGLIINEVCPAKTITKPSWLEIYNPGESSVRLKGLKVALVTSSEGETVIATLQKGTVEAGGYYTIYSDENSFLKPVLRSTFEEISIMDKSGAVIDSFSAKYDCWPQTELEDGFSYSRVPDVTGKWTVSNVATPGAPNYKITPYTLVDLVINEVCPAEGWVEIVNRAKKTQNLEYAYITSAGGERRYTFPGSSILEAGARVVAPLTSDTGSFVLWSNEDRKVAEFSSEGMSLPEEGGSWSRLPDVTGTFQTVYTSTRGEVNSNTISTAEGMVINEICVEEGWVEIANSNIERTVAPRLMLCHTDGSVAASVDAATYEPGGKAVVRTALSGKTGLVLKTADGTEVDKVLFSEVKGTLPSGVRASWSRLPDCTGSLYAVRTPSEGERNYGIEQGNNIAIWVPQSATNAVNLEELCKLGYGQIFLHEYAFKNYGTEKVKSLVAQAESLGQTLHIWMQCFWWNETGWKSPVIDRNGNTPAAYDQAMFDEIINRAKPYVRAGVHGIHFDYVRFAGTAGKHNFPDDGVTAVGAITEFCRQANAALKGLNHSLVLSAAVMGEKAPQGAYGQDISQMSNYLDAFLPMAYISSYNYGPSTNASIAQWFKDKAGDRKVWHGVSTYDSNTKGLSAERIYSDCKNVADNSTVDGVALFRYGIGTLPDLNDLFKK